MKKKYFFIALFCLFTLPGLLAQRTVPVDTEQELIDAVLAAQAGDIIQLSNSFPTDITGISLSVPHALDFIIDGNGKTLQILNNQRHFTFTKSASAGTITVRNITFKGRRTQTDIDNNQHGTDGGGINISSNNSGIYVFDNVNFTSNAGRGLIYAATDIIVQNCTFTYNTGGDHGGAIKGNGNLTVDHCTFYKNVSTGAGGYSGGAIGVINISSTLKITNSVFLENYALTKGGAISSYHGAGCRLMIDSCYFEGNRTLLPDGSSDGGAISIFGGPSNYTILDLRNSTFYKNSAADDGGAVFMENYGPGAVNNIVNCTMYDNEGIDANPATTVQFGITFNVATSGGAIQASLATPVILENNTIIRNYTRSTYQRGGGIGFHASSSGRPAFTMKNNIILGNYILSGSQEITNSHANVGGKALLNPTFPNATTNKNLGYDNGSALSSDMTLQNVFGNSLPVLWENFNGHLAGNPNESDNRFYRSIPTVSLLPNDGKDVFGLAYRQGVATTFPDDQRGYKRDMNNPDVGAIEILWAKFDARGGQWTSMPDLVYKGAEYYQKDTSDNAKNYYEITHNGGLISGYHENPVRDGYSFVGWEILRNGTRWDEIPFTITDTITLGALWHAIPTVTISADTTLCENGTAEVIFSFTGIAPWTLTYNDGISNKNITNIYTSPYIIRVNPASPGITTYTLVSVGDANNSDLPAGGSCTITVNSLPQMATITVPAALCEGIELGMQTPPAITDVDNIIIPGSGKWTLDGVVFDPATDTMERSDDGKLLRYEINTTACGMVKSNAVPVTVSGKPEIIFISDIDTLCAGETLEVVVKANANGSPVTGYEWAVDGTVIPGQTTDTLRYVVRENDDEKLLSIGVTNACGTTTKDKYITDTIMTLPENPGFPMATTTDAGIFPVTIGEDFADPVIDHTNTMGEYYYVTRQDNYNGIPIQHGEMRDLFIEYSNRSYPCTVILVPNGVISTPSLVAGATYFLDEGIYYFSAYGDGAFAKTGIKYVGRYDQDLYPAKSSSIGPNTGGGANATHAVYRFLPNMLFDNIIFDGENVAFAGSGSHKYYMTISGTTDGLVMRKVKFRNIGSSSFSPRMTQYSVLNFYAGAADQINTTLRRYFIDITIESAQLWSTYSAININSTQGIYFRNLKILPSVGNKHAIDISNSASPSPQDPCTDIIFADTLEIPSAKSVGISRYGSRRISLPENFRYLEMKTSGWNPGNTYASSSAIAIKDAALFASATPGSNTAYYDALEGVYLIKPQGNINTQLNDIKNLYTGNAKDYCELPDINIKIAADNSRQTGNFNIPDFGTLPVNLIIMDSILKPVHQQPMMVEYSGAAIAFPSSNSEYIKIHNIDFSGYFSLNDAVTDGNNRVANSQHANFYNCMFKDYGEGEDLLLHVLALSPFAFDTVVICGSYGVDLTSLTPSSGSIDQIALSYYTDSLCTNPVPDPSNVNAAGTYYVKGISQNGCSYVAPVNVKKDNLPVFGPLSTIDTICSGNVLGYINPPAVSDPSNIIIPGTGRWILDRQYFDPENDTLILWDDGKQLYYEVNTRCGWVKSDGIIINVVDVPSLEYFTQIPTLPVGGHLAVSVRAVDNGSPITNYQWYIDGNILLASGPDEDTLHYTIQSINDDGRILTLHAENGCGITSSSHYYKDTITLLRQNPLFPVVSKADNTVTPVSVDHDFTPPVITPFSSPTIRYTGPYYLVTDDQVLLQRYADSIAIDPDKTVPVFIPYANTIFDCKIFAGMDVNVLGQPSDHSSRTIFVDEGNFSMVEAGNIFNKPGIQIVGASSDVGNPSVILSDVPGGNKVRYNFSYPILLENLVFDGNNIELDDYYFAISGGMQSDSLVMDNITFRNIGSSVSTASTNKSVLFVEDGEERNVRARRYLSGITYESASLNTDYSLIELSTADGIYLRDIKVLTDAGNDYAVSISNSMVFADNLINSGNRNIIFAGTLDMPADKRIRIQQYCSRSISFPGMYRFARLNSGWIPRDVNNFAMEILTRSQFDGNNDITNGLFYDIADGTYIVKGNLNPTVQLDNIQSLLWSMAKDYCMIYNPTIKYITSGGTVGGFDLPYYNDIPVDVVFQNSIDDPFRQDPSYVISHDGSGIACDNTYLWNVKMHNLDYSSNYTLYRAAINNDGTTIKNARPSNFYNTIFKAYTPDVNPLMLSVYACNNPGVFEIVCREDTLITLPYGVCNADIDLSLPTVIHWGDSAGIDPGIVLSNNIPQGYVFGAGIHEVIWTATDVCDSVISCSYWIVINNSPCGINDTIWTINRTVDSVVTVIAVDYENNEYSTVRIGCDCWTAENLISTLDRDGNAIQSDVYQAGLYPDTNLNRQRYGRLYTWDAASRQGSADTMGRIPGICPEGWVLPTVKQYETLIPYGSDALRSPGEWLQDNTATNTTGFSALPAGYYDSAVRSFYFLLGDAYFWTATSGKTAHIRYLCPVLQIEDMKAVNGASIRCVKVD